jgi:hypothetical protein
MDRQLRLSVLRRAADIAGGTAQLRSLLGVEQHALDLWLAGRATLPESVFLLAVDVILRDDVARAAQDRRITPRADDSKSAEPPEPAAPPS